MKKEYDEITLDFNKMDSVSRARASKLIEYEMSEECAKTLLNDRHGADAALPANEYLCKVVNDNYGLYGYCVKIHLT